MNAHAVQYTLRAAQLLLQVADCLRGAEQESGIEIVDGDFFEEVLAAGGCRTIQGTTDFLERQKAKK